MKIAENKRPRTHVGGSLSAAQVAAVRGTILAHEYAAFSYLGKLLCPQCLASRTEATDENAKGVRWSSECTQTYRCTGCNRKVYGR
jgi:hypothetical protein